MSVKKKPQQYDKGRLYKIEIDKIKPNPEQARKYLDPKSLKELADSISNKGVLQPILFREEGDKVILVAGERRLRAAKKAKLDKIPAIKIDGDAAEVSLIENLLRENLTPIEETEALHSLMQKHSYEQKDLVKVVNKAEQTISEILKLMELPEEIRNECRDKPEWSRRKLLKIARQPSEKEMIKLFNIEKKKDSIIKEQPSTKAKYGKRGSLVVMASKKIDGFNKYLGKVALDKMQEEEMGALKQNLENLIYSITKILKKLDDYGVP